MPENAVNRQPMPAAPTGSERPTLQDAADRLRYLARTVDDMADLTGSERLSPEIRRELANTQREMATALRTEALLVGGREREAKHLLTQWLEQEIQIVRNSYCTAEERDDPARVDAALNHESPETFKLAVATRKFCRRPPREELRNG